MQQKIIENRVRERIQEAIQHTSELTPSESAEVAFHMTDWLADLDRLVQFYSAPEQFSDQEIHKLLVNFLLHVPNHVAAAAVLLADFPVSDIFQVGAVRNDETT